MAFGDLFLADIRAYREKQLTGTGLHPLFPVWQIPTSELAQTMIASGLRAKITCVDPKLLPKEFAGRDFDSQFLTDLPFTVDPCGENGEFHSFVYAGPGFRHPISVSVGEIVERDGFVFADLIND
jgi:diphthamide synthase (EF-2-diphthine--ammonia ligase)